MKLKLFCDSGPVSGMHMIIRSGIAGGASSHNDAAGSSLPNYPHFHVTKFLFKPPLIRLTPIFVPYAVCTRAFHLMIFQFSILNKSHIAKLR